MLGVNVEGLFPDHDMQFASTDSKIYEGRGLSLQDWSDTVSQSSLANAPPYFPGASNLVSLWRSLGTVVAGENKVPIDPSDLQATTSKEIGPKEPDDDETTSICTEIVEPWMEKLEERLSWALIDDPTLYACVIKHLKPHYETLACLFEDEQTSAFSRKLYGVRQHAYGQSKSTPSTSTHRLSPNSARQNDKPASPWKRSSDDSHEDERDRKRNKSDPIPDPPRPKSRKQLKLICHFSAKDCLRHCKKDGRMFKSSGFSKINDITST